MPRARRPQAAITRSDGQPRPGNVKDPSAVQSNGAARAPEVRTLAPAGAGATMPYGEKGALATDLAETPAPPGVSPAAHAAHQAMQGYRPNVTPLFAPTQRPLESVTAGAPMATGPTNPMAMPIPGQSDVTIANILSDAADASGSSALRNLAAIAQGTAGAAPPASNPFGNAAPGR